MDDDPSVDYDAVKIIGARIPMSAEMLRDAEEYRRWFHDPEYRAEQTVLWEQQEAKRRAALSPLGRWREDHPNWWRRFWPWTVHRWDEDCCERSHDD